MELLSASKIAQDDESLTFSLHVEHQQERHGPSKKQEIRTKNIYVKHKNEKQINIRTQEMTRQNFVSEIENIYNQEMGKKKVDKRQPDS